MIHLQRFDGAAVIEIDHPPVNATSQAVRQGLLDALASVIADDSLGGIVIIGRHGRFSAGGDVRELGNTALNKPSLRDSIALIERSPKPVLAAMTGVALGGGLELALGCHARVGADPLKLGLPEVTLGVIPGAGGTQRLPRIVGAQAALDIATTGRHFSASEAHALGLLDAICEPSRLLETALRQLPSVCMNARAPRNDTAVDLEMFARYRESKRAQWEGQLAPWLIVDAIEYACTRPPEAGLAFERQAYERCQTSPQRAALAYLFSARRRAAKGGLDARAQAIAQALGRQSDSLADAGDRLIAQGLAQNAEEVDVVAVDRLGFAAHLGGPMYRRANRRQGD